MLWRTFVECCGLHVVDDPYMLWMYVVDIILCTVCYMLWRTCCEQHALCCGEHVVHNMYPTTWCLLSTMCCPPHEVLHMLWVANMYMHCGQHVLWVTCCGQHVPMLWRTCSWMLSTTHVCSPQHMTCCGTHLQFFTMFPTTCTHNTWCSPQHAPTTCVPSCVVGACCGEQPPCVVEYMCCGVQRLLPMYTNPWHPGQNSPVFKSNISHFPCLRQTVPLSSSDWPPVRNGDVKTGDAHLWTLESVFLG